MTAKLLLALFTSPCLLGISSCPDSIIIPKASPFFHSDAAVFPLIVTVCYCSIAYRRAVIFAGLLKVLLCKKDLHPPNSCSHVSNASPKQRTFEADVNSNSSSVPSVSGTPAQKRHKKNCRIQDCPVPNFQNPPADVIKSKHHPPQRRAPRLRALPLFYNCSPDNKNEGCPCFHQ